MRLRNQRINLAPSPLLDGSSGAAGGKGRVLSSRLLLVVLAGAGGVAWLYICLAGEGAISESFPSAHERGEARVRGSATIPPAVFLLEFVGQHDFAVVNDTGQFVNIREVRSSCGCLNATLDNRSLAPGESAPLHMEVGLYDRGSRSVHVDLITDAGETWRYVLAASGYPMIEAPNGLDVLSLGRFLPGESVAATVRVFTTSLQPDAPVLHCIDWGVHGGEVVVRNGQVEQRPGEAAWRRPVDLEFWIPGERLAGLQSAELRLRLESSTISEEVEIPVAWHIASRYAVTPRQVYFGAVSAGELPPSALVDIRAIGASQGARIVSAKSDHPAVAVEVIRPGEEATEPATIRIGLGNITAESEATLAAAVEVFLEDHQEPSIIVPVAAMRAVKKAPRPSADVTIPE